MDQEQIVLEVDDRPALEATKRANAGMAEFESKSKTVIDNTGRSWNVYGDVVVRVADRSRNSIDRLVSSMQKQADTYGKTGVERLISQRDQLIKRYQGEERAIEAITKSYEKMISVEQKVQHETEKSHASWNKLFLGAKDVFEGRSAYAEVEAGKFIGSLKGVAMAAGITVAAIGGVLLAGREAMASLGEYGMQIENIHLRTGLAVTSVEQFAFAAKMTGQEVTVYDRLMRGLSQASEDTSKSGDKARATMEKLGISLHDTNTGALKSTEQVLLQVSEALNKLPEGMARDAAAMDLLKRAGVEAIPAISGLSENLKKAKDIGLGVSEEEVKRWERYHENITEAGAIWDRFVRKIKEPLAATIVVLFRDSSNRPLTIDDLHRMGVSAGKYEQPTEAQTWQNFTKATGREKPSYIAENENRHYLDYIAQVDERTATDKSIKSFLSGKLQTDLNYKLKQAEEDLGKLAKPQVGVTSAADLTAYQDADHRVTSIKAQIKAAEKGKQEDAKLTSFENQMYQKPLTGVDKVFADRDDLVRAGADRTRATDAALVGASAVLQKELEAARNNTFAVGADGKNYLSPKGERELALSHDRSDKAFDQDVEKDAKLRGQQLAEALKIRNAGIERSDAVQFGRMNLAASHQMSVIGLTSEKDDSLDSLRQQLTIQRSLRDEELRIKDLHTGVYDMDKERYSAEMENLKDRYEWEEKILSVKHKQFESVKSAAEPLVNTLLTNPSNFGKQFGSTIHAAVLKPIVDGTSNMVSKAVTPLIYGQDGQSGIAGFFKNMFGGEKKDPMKVSMDLNTTVTAQNTAAVSMLTVALSGGRVGGGGSVGSGPAGFAGPTSLSLPALAGISRVTLGGFGNLSLPTPSTVANMPALSGISGIDLGGFGGSFGGPGPGGTAPFVSGPVMDDGGSSIVGGSSGGFGGFGGGSSQSGGGFGGGGLLGGGGASPLSMGKGGFQGMWSSVKGMGSSLKGLVGFGSNVGKDANGTTWITEGNKSYSLGSGAGAVGTQLATSSAATSAGGMLAMSGLTGSHRGTWGGIGMGTAGGALMGAGIGMMFGGPMGALIGAGIGAAAGFGIGVGEKLAGVETPENEAKRLVKSLFSLSIDNNMAKQIVGIAQQKYSGHVSLAVRDPDVRQMLMLFSEATGQKMPMSATTPRSASLVQQGGSLMQAPTYQNGTAYTFQSSLPVAGGYATGTYPSTPSSVTLNVNGQSAADLLDGRVANTVSPSFVQNQWSQAGASSNGRTQNAAMLQQPGLVIN